MTRRTSIKARQVIPSAPSNVPGFVTLRVELQPDSTFLLSELELNAIVDLLLVKGNHRLARLNQCYEVHRDRYLLFQGIYEEHDDGTRFRIRDFRRCSLISPHSLASWRDLILRHCLVNEKYFITDIAKLEIEVPAIERIYMLSTVNSGDKGKLCHFRALIAAKQLSSEITAIYLWEAYRAKRGLNKKFHDCVISSYDLQFNHHPYLDDVPCQNCGCTEVSEFVASHVRAKGPQDALERRSWMMDSMSHRSSNRDLMLHLSKHYWAKDQVNIPHTGSTKRGNLPVLLKNLHDRKDKDQLRSQMAKLVLDRLLRVIGVSIDEPPIGTFSISIDETARVILHTNCRLAMLDDNTSLISPRTGVMLCGGIIVRLTSELYQFLVSSSIGRRPMDKDKLCEWIQDLTAEAC